MVNTHSFAGVAAGSHLVFEVKQEGEAHAVRGRLGHDGRSVHLWMKGELEDRVTRVTLDDAGLYQLTVYVAFFGPTEETVTIGLTIESSFGSPLHSQRLELRRAAGAMQTFLPPCR
jgi:hypothetical protein